MKEYALMDITLVNIKLVYGVAVFLYLFACCN